MSYTHAELVRQYLSPIGAAGEAVHDQAVVIGESGRVRFFSGAVVGDSVVVKSVRDGTRLYRALELDSQHLPLASGPVVPGTVVVSSDSSLGRIYVENRDYVIVHGSGLLTVKAGGDLAIGMTVAVWYLPYTVYERSVDYALDEQNAELTVLTSGGLSVGERVWLDYRPVHDTYTDELIAQAVTEANASVAAEVDVEGAFGTDPLLQSAATYRALAAVARSSAGRHLGSGRGTYRDAETWLTLAGQYAARADELLRSFGPPYSNPAAPRRS